MCICVDGQTERDVQKQKILLCRMLTTNNCQSFCNSRSLTLHCIVVRVQKTCINMSFVSQVWKKLRYDHMWYKPTVQVSSVILFAFPHEHDNNCFLLSAMMSMNVKTKLRILSSYFQKQNIWCLYKMLPVKTLTTSSHSNHKFNVANNAHFTYIYICLSQISPACFGAYCTILRGNVLSLSKNYLLL